MTTYSVIINTYNRRDKLEALINDVLGLGHPDYEVIVADDGSTDGTAEMVERVVDPRLQYVRQDNAGLGAARNLEGGGSLTILATALVETGSVTDEVIFEEFASAANMELRLRGDLAEERLFPAVDVARSGTRREELLMSEQEVEILGRFRRSLADLEPAKAHEALAERLRRTSTNIELLRGVQAGS